MQINNTINDLADVWINSTHTSISNITNMINSTKEYEQEFVELAKFILSTKINPYQYLPFGWCNCLHSAQLTETLLHVIHHALVDDGDLCWVNTEVHGPHLEFNHYTETDLIQKKVNQRYSMLRCGVNYTTHPYSSDFIKELTNYESIHAAKVANHFNK